MYTREEKMPEENVDWDESQKKPDESETKTKSQETKHVIHPAKEKNRIVLQKNINFSKLGLKNSIKTLLDQYGEFSLLLGLLILPYLIGFIVVSVVLIYGGVPINRFFSLKEGIFHFELWSIGAYISITAGVVWLLVMLMMQRR